MLDLRPTKIASTQWHHQKGLKYEQPLAKKMKLFENDSNDKTLKPTFHIMKDLNEFGSFCFCF
jgi:hypothetical protein